MKQLKIFMYGIILIVLLPNFLFSQSEVDKTLIKLDSSLNCSGLKIDTIKVLNNLKYVDCLVKDYLPELDDGLEKIYRAKIKTIDNKSADYRTYILVYNDTIQSVANYNLLFELFEKEKFVDNADPCFKGVKYYTFDNFLLMSITSITYAPKIEEATKCKLIHYLMFND